MKTQSLKKQLASLINNGYVLVPLQNTKPIDDLRHTVFEKIASFFKESDVEHLSFPERRPIDDDTYLELLKYVHSENPERRVLRHLCDQVRPLITILLGENIAVQRAPNVRLQRAGSSREALDFHRDVYYGASFFDINIWVPLHSLTEPALDIVPGSHLPANGRLEEVKEIEPNWDPASIKGQVPIPYAPKTVDYKPEEFISANIPYGSLLIFFGSLLHASHVHLKTFVRISVDFRVTPLLLPRILRQTKPAFFIPLYVTPVFERILKCYPYSEVDYL